MYAERLQNTRFKVKQIFQTSLYTIAKFASILHQSNCNIWFKLYAQSNKR